MKYLSARFGLLMLVLLVSGYATADEEVDQRACAKNFTVSGSFFSGKTYKSHQEFTGMSESNAFTKVAQHLASSGWNITNTDKSLGMITATQGVIAGEGKTVPLNVVVKKLNNGKVRVECIFSMSAMLVTSEDSAKQEFCQIIGSVGM